MLAEISTKMAEKWPLSTDISANKAEFFRAAVSYNQKN
jgi:hypothetical protein